MTPLDTQEIVRFEQDHVLHPWSAQKNFKPFVVAGGLGVHFWDDKGKRYLDFCSQLFNVNAGHQHPRIIQAIKDQAEKLCYAYPSAATEPRAKLAKMLADIAPGDIDSVLFMNCGAEANENAVRMARAVTGRHKIIARYRGFHGGAAGAAVFGDPRRRAFEPYVQGGIRVWDPYCYRCFFRMTYPACGLYCAEAIREVIEVEGPETIAAIMMEPITGSNCRIVPPEGYMQRLRGICDDYGILLILDEVMTGFGRTGKWFAADLWNVVPDMITSSKGITNGALPLGVVMVRRKVAEYFDDRILYAGSTQMGNPIVAAAAVAAIEVYRDEGLVENSRVLGRYLMERLERIRDQHPSVGEVRGKGLFAGIELVKNKETREPLIPWTVRYYEQKHPFAGRLLGKLKEDGLFVEMRWNVLMVAPPLCIGKEDLDKGLGKIDQALAIADDFAKGDKG